MKINSVTADRFQNSSSHHTGDLNVKMWLSNDIYNGGTLNGTLIAQGYLGTLTDGYGWDKKQVTVTRNDNYGNTHGTYHVIITVNELSYDSKGVMHDYIVGWTSFKATSNW